MTIDGDTGEIVLRGTVDEAADVRLASRGSVTTISTGGSPGLSVTDTVTNLSAESGDFELLYHVNFGMPLVQPGSRVVVPVKTMAPRDAAALADLATWNGYGRESPGLPEAVFFFELATDAAAATQTLLVNTAGLAGRQPEVQYAAVALFPFWKNRQAACDGYVTDIEPAANFPNVRSFDKRNGRVVGLAAGESHALKLELEAHSDAAARPGRRGRNREDPAGTNPSSTPSRWPSGRDFRNA